ncbi:MAG: extracellular solute-binding protein [Lachnospiraceae bacterium]
MGQWKKFKKTVALILACGMLLGGMAGCACNNGGNAGNNNGTTTQAPEGGQASGGEVKKITLTVWSPAEDQAAYKGVPNGLLAKWCTEFDEAHPEWDITFRYGVCSESDARDVVTKDLDTAADVYMYANDQLATLVGAGALAEFGGSAVETIRETNSDTIYRSVVYEDGVYGVPYTPNTLILYYNSSMLTGEDVTSLNTMLEKDLGNGVAAFGFELTDSWYIEQFYYAAGFSLYGENGTEQEKGTNIGDFGYVTEFLVDLVKNPRFHKEAGDDSIARLANGTLASLVSGSWKASAVKEALGENFATAQLPTVTYDNGVSGVMRQFTGSKAVGVNPRSNHMAAAVALALYLGGESVQRDRFVYRDITPTNVTLAASEEVLASPVAAAENAVVLNTSVVQPTVPEITNWFQIVETFAEEIYNGSVTKQNAEKRTRELEEALNAGTGF